MRANDISEIVEFADTKIVALRQVRLKQLDALGIRKYSNKRREKKMIYTYFEDDERAPCLASGAVYCPLA